MKLTGKASSYFYSWLHQRFDYEPAYNAISSSEWFESLHPSMQWGIFQDWADSIGYCIYVKQDFDGFLNYLRGYIPFFDGDAIYKNNDCFETRQEARDAAIEKLNELVNGEK